MATDVVVERDWTFDVVGRAYHRLLEANLIDNDEPGKRLGRELHELMHGLAGDRLHECEVAIDWLLGSYENWGDCGDE